VKQRLPVLRTSLHIALPKSCVLGDTRSLAKGIVKKVRSWCDCAAMPILCVPAWRILLLRSFDKCFQRFLACVDRSRGADLGKVWVQHGGKFFACGFYGRPVELFFAALQIC